MKTTHDLPRNYQGKTILITGHTGFKGAWLSIWLCELGARVIGFSLPKWDNSRLFEEAGLGGRVVDERGDIANLQKLEDVFSRYRPQIVFHLAAQPLVRESYQSPVETFRANVIGTVNVLECVRKFKFVKQAVIITTDKCYKNKERRRGYKETEELGGHDPYSASKAAAELVIDSYTKAFFIHSRKWVASARSGNVIGGGDYSKERIVPDCIQALRKHRPVRIRHPKATRPWQHVLEPLSGYLLLGTKLLQGQEAFTGAWNFGPEKKSIVPVYQVVDLVIRNWGSGRWVTAPDSGDLHEATLLSLDISKAKTRLKWRPKWDINRAVHETVRWYRAVDKKNAYQLCAEQIAEYMNEG